MVAGCYEGSYIEHLHGMFPAARIAGFEPQPEPWRLAYAKFHGNRSIDIYPEALGTRSGMQQMVYPGTVGASLIGKGETPSNTVRVIDTVNYFKGLAARTGLPYQNLINLFLRDCAVRQKEPSLTWAGTSRRTKRSTRRPAARSAGEHGR